MNLLSLIGLIFVSVWSSSTFICRVFGDFGVDELTSLRDDIRDLMLENEIGLTDSSGLIDPFDILKKHEIPLIASLVRLAFHDCTGEFPTRCDGCLTLGIAPNAGLEEGSITPLSDICGEYKDDYGLSTGDCWSLAATFGLELSGELTKSNWEEINDDFGGDLTDDDFPDQLFKSGSIPYYIGRIDCENTPDVEEGTFEAFPAPPDSWEVIQGYFGPRFGLTNKEIVALISGGHSLGRGHREISNDARSGPWDISPNTLDNEYHKGLLGENRLLDSFNWEKGNFLGGRGPGQFFINSTRTSYDFKFTEFGEPFEDDRAYFMLDADINLAFNRTFRDGIDSPECMTIASKFCSDKHAGSVVLEGGESEDDYPEGTVFCPEIQCPLQCEGGQNELDGYISDNFDNLDDDYDACPVAWIRQFADDNEQFGETFIRAYTKVITSGYELVSIGDSSDDSSDEQDPYLDYLTAIDVEFDSESFDSSED